jgi:hypothetical protein
VKQRPTDDHRRRLAGRCGYRGPSPDELIPDTLWWELRYHAAMRAACYVTIRIDAHHLRARVVEHVAVCWWRCCLHGGHPDGLDGFFRDYCRDVEHDVDRQAKDVSWELHRVWTNHAVMLGSDPDEVCRRP